jgi:tetratricopeptide (TPR) repeat protein
MLFMPKLLAALSTAALILTILGPGPALTQNRPQPQDAPRKEAPGKDAQGKESPGKDAQGKDSPGKDALKGARRGAPTPSMPKTAAERDRALGDLYALLATAEDENAAKAIAEGIERIWHHSGSPTVDLLMGRAMKSIGAKKLDRALEFLDNVVEQAPDFTEGWSRRAYVHFQRNDVGNALGDLRRALALDPNHFKSLDGLAQILREIGQKKAALEVFRHLDDVHPYWQGVRQAIDELSREVEGQGI